MLDIFRNDAFGLVALTDAINKAPFVPRQIGATGLFTETGIDRTTVVVEEKDGHLELVQTSERGSPAATYADNKATARAFKVPHLAKERTILADQVQSVRLFGSADRTPAVQALVNEKLGEIRRDIEVTLEHMRASALQGILKDADGSTLFNWFTEFGVVQQTGEITPSASDEGDDLRGEITGFQRLVEAELGNEVVTGYRAYCGKDFFDALRGDYSVTQTLRYADPASLLQQEAGVRRFNFGGVTWEEYRGSTGGSPFFADGEAYLYPVGSSIFKTYFAPADFMETVNTIGLPMYSKTAVDQEYNRWAKVHGQSNPLVICLRPRAVIKLTVGT